ncbi:MAG: UDP-N-acetylmuramoyl-tripeptide--D-alanyl-D-alanine ligase [Pseudomonadota bacterium]
MSAALWTSRDADRATGGRSLAPWQATGVSIDSRTVQPGDLFVALKDQRDGHAFVAAALQAGASAAIVDHVPEGVPDTAPLLLVEDTFKALEDLGKAARARTDAKVIAVTGSVGKTSTKEMLRTMLRGQGLTHASVASYNNHWGVPLTLARMPEATEFAVIEIGMNAPGEILPLAQMARPHVALVTTVAAAHLAAFENLAAIAREKGSIYQALEPGGLALVPMGLETSWVLTDCAKGHQIREFGSEDAAYFASDVQLHETSTVVSAQAMDSEFLFKINAVGRHYAYNALASLAGVEALGADLGRAVIDLNLWDPPDGRGQRLRLFLDIGDDKSGIDLIDDAYNANPTSMAAAFEVLAVAQPTDNTGRVSKGRRLAILGDMLELGQTELDLHAGLAQDEHLAAISKVHCVGPRMRALWTALPEPQRGVCVEDPDMLIAVLPQLIDAGDVVLVKGSKGSEVHRVVTALKKLGVVLGEEG